MLRKAPSVKLVSLRVNGAEIVFNPSATVGELSESMWPIEVPTYSFLPFFKSDCLFLLCTCILSNTTIISIFPGHKRLIASPPVCGFPMAGPLAPQGSRFLYSIDYLLTIFVVYCGSAGRRPGPL
ncbi:putative beta-ureidopropionase [Helianthus annuus]|nr:putative beta-ureidopropionase [Helianthus annuus]